MVISIYHNYVEYYFFKPGAHQLTFAQFLEITFMQDTNMCVSNPG